MHGIEMTKKELNRVQVLEEVNSGHTRRSNAAERLGVSVRQLDRLKQKLSNHGPASLAHGNRGRRSNNGLKEDFKEKAMMLVRTNYHDFGPTLAAEKLERVHQIKISKEKLRQLMTEEGLWKAGKRKKKKAHPRRPRRSHYGDLLQGDGSDHNWFENRGPRCALVAFIDDATNRVYGRFFPSETTKSYMELLKRYIIKQGKPRSLYVDKSSIFRLNKDQMKQSNTDTQFGRMMKELDVNLICAHSPQAKGRVERLFDTLQDRLVKELRLEEIDNIEEANKYLEDTFWGEYNNRWTYEPLEEENFHKKSPPEGDLERIFTIRNERKISKSLDFSFEGELFQIQTKTPHRVMGKRVTIMERIDGSIWAECEGEEIGIVPFKSLEAVTPIVDAKSINAFLEKKKPLSAVERRRQGAGCCWG